MGKGRYSSIKMRTSRKFSRPCIESTRPWKGAYGRLGTAGIAFFSKSIARNSSLSELAFGSYHLFYHALVFWIMGRFDAATIAFSFLIIGGLGIVMFFSSPMIGSILLFGAIFILLYGWLEMTADIRDSLIDLNKRLAEMESPEKIEK